MLFLGNPNKKAPSIVGQRDYGKKRFENLLQWDPRPVALRHTTTTARNNFVTSIQMMESFNEPKPNFAASLKITYWDYELDEDRKLVLKENVAIFHNYLKTNLELMVDSHGLSNDYALHVSSTMDQADSEEWKR